MRHVHISLGHAHLLWRGLEDPRLQRAAHALYQDRPRSSALHLLCRQALRTLEGSALGSFQRGVDQGRLEKRKVGSRRDRLDSATRVVLGRKSLPSASLDTHIRLDGVKWRWDQVSSNSEPREADSGQTSGDPSGLRAHVPVLVFPSRGGPPDVSKPGLFSAWR